MKKIYLFLVLGTVAMFGCPKPHDNATPAAGTTPMAASGAVHAGVTSGSPKITLVPPANSNQPIQFTNPSVSGGGKTIYVCGWFNFQQGNSTIVVFNQTTNTLVGALGNSSPNPVPQPGFAGVIAVPADTMSQTYIVTVKNDTAKGAPAPNFMSVATSGPSSVSAVNPNSGMTTTTYLGSQSSQTNAATVTIIDSNILQ
jgi:hypothetical protein